MNVCEFTDRRKDERTMGKMKSFFFFFFSKRNENFSAEAFIRMGVGDETGQAMRRVVFDFRCFSKKDNGNRNILVVHKQEIGKHENCSAVQSRVLLLTASAPVLF